MLDGSLTIEVVTIDKKRSSKHEYFPTYTPGKKVEKYIYWSEDLHKHYDVHFYLVIGGKQISRKSSNHKSKREAQKSLKKMQMELWDLRTKEKGNDRKWHEAQRRAFKKIEIRLKNKQGTSTELINIKETLIKHTSTWDNLWLSDITKSKIKDHVDGLINSGTGQALTLSTKNKIIGYISKVFIANEWEDNNPAKGLKAEGWSQRQKQRRIEVGLTLEEVHKLIDYTTAIKSPWSLIYSFALFLGARSGELFSLKFSDIKRDENGEPKKIEIASNYCWRTKQYKLPKNNEKRTIPLNQTLIETIKFIEKNKFDEFYILPRIPDWKYGKASERLREFLVELKIILPESQRNPAERATSKDYFRFHDLRATFISIAIDQTRSLKAVAEIAGHFSLATTDIYLRKSNDEALQSVVDSLDMAKKKKSGTPASLDEHRSKKRASKR